MPTCPYCLSDRTRMSRFRGGDYTQLILLRLPYRCRDCGSRFRQALIGNTATLIDIKVPSRLDVDEPDTAAAPAAAVAPGEGQAPAPTPGAKPAPKPAPKRQERRKSARYPCSLETYCYPTGKGETQYLSWILNLSAGGMKLHAERTFQPGDAITVRFRTERRGGPRKFHLHVIHVYAADEEDKKGNTTLGCQFRSELSQKDLDAILRM